MDCVTHVKPRIVTHLRKAGQMLAGLALLLSFPLLAPADTLPSGREVLRLARNTEAAQYHNLTGRLRMSTDDGNIIIPFRLDMHGSTITYQFSNPPEALVLRLGENGSKLERITGSGKAQTVSGAKLDAPIRGTDITYEDLALRFLYWNNATVAGEDNLMTRRCWLVQAVPSGRSDSQYDMVRLWVDKSGGLLKAECYAHGKMVKEFKVTNVQHAGDGSGYILKTMRVQSTGKETPTYLEINPS